MAVFRINKTRDYTVMSNYHLRDRELSCKACGLLSKMLSLPDEWDYTVRGLAAICRDGVDAIRSGLKELEDCGYLVRRYLRDEKGRIADMEYVIYEAPQTSDRHESDPDTEEPPMLCPHTENPFPDAPLPENAAQLNINKSSTKGSTTKGSNTKKENRSASEFSPSVFLPEAAPQSENGNLTDGRTERESIREQIEYERLLEQYPKERLDELVELMVEVELTQNPTIRIGKGEAYPAEYVRGRFRRITTGHMEKVMDGLMENTTRVRNTKAYLLAALFNSVSTLDNHYAMLVNHDFYGKSREG